MSSAMKKTTTEPEKAQLTSYPDASHIVTLSNAEDVVVEISQPAEDLLLPVEPVIISKVRGITVIVTLAGICCLHTMGSGILIAAMPRMIRDVGLSEALILWPAAVYAISAGCLLLVVATVADIIGAKPMWIVGSYLYCALTLGLGFSKTGTQVIVFRVLLGAAISLCLPTNVSLITNQFPKGSWRNAAFAINGMGHPIGFAIGLVLGGIFTDTIGWRWSYYLMAIVNFILSTASIWSLPNPRHHTDKTLLERLATIDWVGAVVLSAAMGLLMYILAETTMSYRSIGYARNAALLAVSLVLLIFFPFWMHWQTKKRRPALIPNKLWHNMLFTSMCISVFFGWTSFNGSQYFMTLYFQEVEGLSAFESSRRFIAQAVSGVCVNFAAGYLISRVKIQTLSGVSAAITMVSPLLMALITVGQNYWFSPFWALVLAPINPDVLFTASNLVISEAFPPDVQSLAGGVFNEIAQFGNSVGLVVTGAIAASVQERSQAGSLKESLMEGYRAAFWVSFAEAATVMLVSIIGFRKAGLLGKKDA